MSAPLEFDPEKVERQFLDNHSKWEVLAGNGSGWVLRLTSTHCWICTARK